MTAPRPPGDTEAARLAALRRLCGPGSEPEPLLEALARQAAAVCEAPVAMLNLVDAEQQWCAAQQGVLALPGPPQMLRLERDAAFCAHTILGDEPLQVSDAAADPRFAHNPLVTGTPGLRFYAGVPLRAEGAHRVGALCVFDLRPRALSPAQLQALQQLAELATLALALRARLLQQAQGVQAQHGTGLAQGEGHYRSIVEQQDELVSVAQPDGTLLYVNAAYARRFGHTPAELVGRKLFEWVQPQDRAAVAERFAALRPGGPAGTGENRALSADAGPRWLAWTNRLVRGAEGQVLLYSVGRDVTDLKRAEAALRASQAFLERTGRVAGVGGWELDLASGRITWSQQTRRIHGVPDDYAPQLDTAIAFYAPEARPVIEAAVRHAIATGEGWDLELPLDTADGRRIWVRVEGEVEREDGRAVRLIGAFNDITERYALQQQVAERERFLSQLADSLPLRVAYLDAQRRYRFVNAGWLAAAGLTREQVLGRTRAELWPQLDDAPWARAAAAALAGQLASFEFDEETPAAAPADAAEGTAESAAAGDGGGDQGPRHIENRLVRDLDEQGRVRGLFVAGIDITQRSRAEAARRRLSSIVEHTTDFVLQADRAGRLIYLNPAARRALGLADDAALTGRHAAACLPPQRWHAWRRQAVPAALRSGAWLGETQLHLGDGRTLPVSQMLLVHRDSRGRVERWSSILRDISLQVQAQRELARQAEVLRLVADAVPARVAVVGQDGQWSFVNAAFERCYGLRREQLIGRSALEFLGPAEFERRLPWVRRALAGEAVRFEGVQQRAEGDAVLDIRYVPLRRADGMLDGYVSVAHDVTLQRQEERRLRALAQRDPLSGLLNRGGFDAALQAMQAGAHTLALLYIDLDFFKPVNDTYGHPVGDEVLRQFGQRLARLVRSVDAVARVGGDEFAVAVPNLPEAAKAQALADKVLAAAAQPFDAGGHCVSIGASVGVAFGDLRHTPWAELLRKADERLLAAKAAGRGRQFADTR